MILALEVPRNLYNLFPVELVFQVSENKSPTNKEMSSQYVFMVDLFSFAVLSNLKAGKVWSISRLRLEMSSVGNGQHSQH